MRRIRDFSLGRNRKSLSATFPALTNKCALAGSRGKASAVTLPLEAEWIAKAIGII